MSNRETLLHRSISRFEHHFAVALTNFPISSRASGPEPIVEIDRLHIRGGTDKPTLALFGFYDEY